MDTERTQLIREGRYLYERIADDHFNASRHKIFVMAEDGKTVKSRQIPWPIQESVYLALALFARKREIQEGINNAD